MVPEITHINFSEKFGEDGKSKSFEKKLEKITKTNSKATFVVELMNSKSGKPFFKVYDTVFLP